MQSKIFKIALIAAALVILLASCGPKSTAKVSGELTIGMILVGPHNDFGWTQATYEGAEYATQHIDGSQVIYIENAYAQVAHCVI